MGRGVGIVASRAVPLPDGSVMVGILLQSGRHVHHRSPVRQWDLLIVATEAGVQERAFQESGQRGGMTTVAIATLLLLIDRAVDDLASRHLLLDIFMAV